MNYAEEIETTLENPNSCLFMLTEYQKTAVRNLCALSFLEGQCQQHEKIMKTLDKKNGGHTDLFKMGWDAAKEKVDSISPGEEENLSKSHPGT